MKFFPKWISLSNSSYKICDLGITYPSIIVYKLLFAPSYRRIALWISVNHWSSETQSLLWAMFIIPSISNLLCQGCSLGRDRSWDCLRIHIILLGSLWADWYTCLLSLPYAITFCCRKNTNIIYTAKDSVKHYLGISPNICLLYSIPFLKQRIYVGLSSPTIVLFFILLFLFDRYSSYCLG